MGFFLSLVDADHRLHAGHYESVSRRYAMPFLA
jgi:hypothetical protein